ncbi:MAG: hypothetical protein ACTSYI_02395, partial [Promethearchaeota archaeon]
IERLYFLSPVAKNSDWYFKHGLRSSDNHCQNTPSDNISYSGKRYCDRFCSAFFSRLVGDLK